MGIREGILFGCHFFLFYFFLSCFDSISDDPSSQPQGPGQGTFHVFLSFRGPDVRKAFLSFLYEALHREGIHAYMDSVDLQIGAEITPSLKKAIRDTRIAIVIISENYAYSHWCLEELAEIMDLWKQGELIVKPVFYRVEPREVRTPRNSFAKAVAVHEAKLGKDSAMLKRWKKALSKVGKLSGWELDAHRNEAELVRKIVKDINVMLHLTCLDVAKFPVGIETQLTQIKNLLNMESDDQVLFVGIWGMAGVGKTTLAKAIFNAVAEQFEGCAFLPNVREDSVNPSVGLARLQENLMSEMLRRKVVRVGSIAGGITHIRDLLRQVKVLLILDDINSREQLEALAGGLDWFGNGSRIVITTSDKSILVAADVHVIHKVEGLPNTKALQLFRKHAFPENCRSHNIAKDLIDRCLAYCDGLPLALVKMGSYLRNREERHWINKLHLLEKHPCHEIDKVLRVSFDDLDHNEREIFLAISCRFKGQIRREIENAMDAHGFETSLGIDILVERSMITIVKDTTHSSSVERVEIHPLLQMTGRNIFHQESVVRRTSTWIQRDIFHMSNRMGTRKVKALALRPTNLKDRRALTMWNVDRDADPMGELSQIEWSGHSFTNTIFSRPRTFKVQDSCERMFSNILRVTPHGDSSWRNAKVARSVVHCRFRSPQTMFGAPFSITRVSFNLHPYRILKQHLGTQTITYQGLL